jgi:hypothetical protein
MVGMKVVPIPMRFALAALLALLLGVRSLAPLGFMPAFDHGSVAIVACPDLDAPLVSPAGHHHHSGDHQFAHQPCPYAAASALGALGKDIMPLLAVLLFGAVLVGGRAFLFVERQGRRERPPSRAPPLPA